MSDEKFRLPAPRGYDDVTPKPVAHPQAEAEPLTMSSLEIANLVGVRHDNVKRAIVRLSISGAISLPPTEEVKVARARRSEAAQVYAIGKRDSYVIVAQLSPVFTAKLVDRWQELEARVANPARFPQFEGISKPTNTLEIRWGDTVISLSNVPDSQLESVVKSALRTAR